MSEDEKKMPVASQKKTVARRRALSKGYFDEYIKHLYSLGSSSQRKAPIGKRGTGRRVGDATDSQESDTYTPLELHESAWNLLALVWAWEDPSLREARGVSKADRHILKHKKNIDKLARRKIRTATFKEAEVLVKQLDILSRNKDVKTEVQAEAGNLTVAMHELLDRLDVRDDGQRVSTKELIAVLRTGIELLKQIDVSLVQPDDTDMAARIAKASKAINAFTRPSDTFFRVFSAGIAFFGGLSCGVITGGLILLLLMGPLGVIPAGIIAGFVFLAGFISNFRFFGKTLPEFFQKLSHNGGITEYINEDGERVHISAGRKVFLVVAALCSLAVGFSTAAFTATSIAHILAALLPALAVACPALPAVIIGVLGVAICMAMSIIMFKAFVDVAPRLSLAKAWQAMKDFWATLTPGKALATFIKAAFVLFAGFGLGFLVYSGWISLSELAQKLCGMSQFAAQIVMGIVSVSAFVGQFPFTVRTVSASYNFVVDRLVQVVKALSNVFRGGRSERAPQDGGGPAVVIEEERGSLLSRVGSFLSQLGIWGCLLCNAIGNAVLVVAITVISYIAGVACFIISVSSNLIQPNGQEQARAQANKESVRLFREGECTDKDNTKDTTDRCHVSAEVSLSDDRRASVTEGVPKKADGTTLLFFTKDGSASTKAKASMSKAVDVSQPLLTARP